MTEIRAAAPRPVALADRALAPDLARGVMLLLIALANAHLYLYDHTVGVRGYPVGLDASGQLVTLLQMVLVDGRAYPMFGFLFGYGVVQLARRRTDPVTARRLVRRRGAWMLLIGFLHALLLFAGDIVAAYGLLALLLAPVLTSGRDRTLLVVGACGLTVAGLFGLAMGLPAVPGARSILPSMAISEPQVAALFRVVEFGAVGLAGNALLVFGAVALGAWAARRRLLDDPAAHRAVLRRTAGVGLGLAALGGLPMALLAAGYWTTSLGVVMLTGALHTVTGYAGGLGYAALIALVAMRVVDRPGPVVHALTACGRRSLSCYLAQSVVFVAVFAAWGGGLGDQLGVATTAAVATATWLVILLAAAAMQRVGHRGPAEILLRRLTYGRPDAA